MMWMNMKHTTGLIKIMTKQKQKILLLHAIKHLVLQLIVSSILLLRFIY